MWWSLLFLALIPFANSLAIPPATFVKDFAMAHQLTNIILHTSDSSSTSTSVKWFKAMRAGSKGNFFLALNIPKMDLNQQRSGKDLHVFIPNESKFDESLNRFFDLFATRTRTNREYWLLDLTKVNKSAKEVAETKLKRLKTLDLDDDLYLLEKTRMETKPPRFDAPIGCTCSCPAYQFPQVMKMNEGGLKIWEFYEILPNIQRQFQPYGTWSEKKGLILHEPSQWIRRKNLQGATLKTQSLPAAYFIKELLPIQNHPGQYNVTGLFADVWFAVQKELNFTFVVTKPLDRAWGNQRENGSWTGIIGNFVEKTVDIGLTSMAQTFERSHVASFSYPLVETHMVLVIKNPVDAYYYSAFIDQLKGITWMAIGLFCIIFPVFLTVMTRIGSDDNAVKFNLSNSFALAFQALISKGWKTTPNRLSGKIIFFCIVGLNFLIHLHWRSKLISYLAKRNIDLPYTDVQTLLLQSQDQIATLPGSSFVDDFKLSRDPSMMKAWKERLEPNMEKYKIITGKEKAEMKLFELPNTALYMNDKPAMNTKEYKSCSIIVLPKVYVYKKYSMGFQKDSPFLKLFNHYFKTMAERGLLDQITKTYDPLPQECPDYTGTALGFHTLNFPFLVISGGVIISFVIGMLEYLFRVINARKDDPVINIAGLQEGGEEPTPIEVS